MTSTAFSFLSFAHVSYQDHPFLGSFCINHLSITYYSAIKGRGGWSEEWPSIEDSIEEICDWRCQREKKKRMKYVCPQYSIRRFISTQSCKRRCEKCQKGFPHRHGGIRECKHVGVTAYDCGQGSFCDTKCYAEVCCVI